MPTKLTSQAHPARVARRFAQSHRPARRVPPVATLLLLVALGALSALSGWMLFVGVARSTQPSAAAPPAQPSRAASAPSRTRAARAQAQVPPMTAVRVAGDGLPSAMTGVETERRALLAHYAPDDLAAVYERALSAPRDHAGDPAALRAYFRQRLEINRRAVALESQQIEAGEVTDPAAVAEAEARITLNRDLSRLLAHRLSQL